MIKKKKQIIGASGFTLLEMVIVMAMIGIISGASFKLIKFSETHRTLSIATAEVKGAIRTAQTLALAPPIIGPNTVCGFGVKEGTSDSELEVYYSYSNSNDPKTCRGIAALGDACDGTINGCSKYETKFFDGFTLAQDSGNNVDIFFRSPYGKVFGEGEITITQTSNGYFKKIDVNKYGKINSQ